MDTIQDKYLKEHMGEFLTDKEDGKRLKLLAKSLTGSDSLSDKRHKNYDSKLRKYNKQAMKKI